MHSAWRSVVVLTAFVAALTGGVMTATAADVRLELREGWVIQSSAKVTAGGEAVSRPGFAAAGWHRASVPTTVVSALVADGTYPDPYYGMNLRKIPGTTYKVGTNFSNVEMPADVDGPPAAANGAGTKMMEQSAPVADRASLTVLNTGSDSTVCPPLPGVTPPTTCVPS